MVWGARPRVPRCVCGLCQRSERPAPVTRGAARTAGPAPDPRSWKPQGGLAGEGPGTHVVRGSLLAVHGPRHVHAAGHGVDAEDLHGRLVRAHARDAVADGDVVVFVGADLEGGAGGGASGLGVPRRCWEPRVGVLRDLPCAHQAVGRPRHRVLNDAPWGVRRAAGTHCLAQGWGWGWGRGWAGALRRPRP